MSNRTHLERYPTYSIKRTFGCIPRWFRVWTRKRARRLQDRTDSEAEYRAAERARSGWLQYWY